MSGGLLGGGSGSEVVRVGRTARRPGRPWSPTVLDLLRYLEDEGFAGAPRAVGIDDEGREVVTWVDGDAGSSLPDLDTDRPVGPDHWAWRDDVLTSLGRLVRKLHDAAPTFSTQGRTWQVKPGQPAETVCHHDLSPANTVFRDGLPVAFVDWEAASPGPRARDLGFVAWSWVPFGPAARSAAAGLPTGVEEKVRRYHLLLDAYGVRPDEALLRSGTERMQRFREHLTALAAAGAAWEVRLAKRGVLDQLSAEIAWVEQHLAELVTP